MNTAPNKLVIDRTPEEMSYTYCLPFPKGYTPPLMRGHRFKDEQGHGWIVERLAPERGIKMRDPEQ